MGCRGSLGTQGGLCKQGAVVTRKRNLFSRLLVGLPGNISWEQRLSGLRVFFFLIKKEKKKFEKQQSSSFLPPKRGNREAAKTDGFASVLCWDVPGLWCCASVTIPASVPFPAVHRRKRPETLTVSERLLVKRHHTSLVFSIWASNGHVCPFPLTLPPSNLLARAHLTHKTSLCFACSSVHAADWGRPAGLFVDISANYLATDHWDRSGWRFN